MEARPEGSSKAAPAPKDAPATGGDPGTAWIQTLAGEWRRLWTRERELQLRAGAPLR
jgi:hypothetical protein